MTDPHKMSARYFVHGGEVVCSFSHPMEWFSMTAEGAREMAAGFIRCADEIDAANKEKGKPPV